MIMKKICFITACLAIVFCGTAYATEKVKLTCGDVSRWRESADWSMVGDVFEHPKNENLLSVREGTETLVNGRTMKSPNLVSRDEFGDAKIHVEFIIPKNSNSGIYLQGRYEIQIYDSWTDANSKYPGIECGGIYQRWDESRTVKGYEGHSPLINATRPPGQWQSFDIIFKSPRFDKEGVKTANARVVKMRHNGILIHDDVELTGITRGSPYAKESEKGPILLQGDHGPVAFRNFWAAPIDLDRMGLTNPFFAMDTGTIDDAHKSAESQAQMLKELGYAGIGYWERDGSKGAAGLAEMLGELDKNGLKAFPEYFTIKLEEQNEKFMPLITESIGLLAGRGTYVWLAITSDSQRKSSPGGDEKAVAIIRQIADIAHEQGVGVALYPHVNFWLEKTDDAIRVAEKANRRNVGITFNLYHYLKTRNSADVNTAIQKAMPYLFAVTINGTTPAGSIETLDSGTFDVYAFLKELKNKGFKGQIGLQHYGITGDVHVNLKRSMEAWKRFSQRLAIEEAEALQ